MTEMSVIRLLKGFVWAALGMLLALSQSVSAMAENKETQELRSYVETKANLLNEKFRSEKQMYYDDPERFFTEWEVTLQTVVDFRRIAGRVMGRHAREASKDQRQQFVERFTRSLMETYAKAMVEAEGYEIRLTGAEINAQDASRGSVSFDVVAPDGKKHAVNYSMFKNDAGVWMIENIIVEGINIGLAFREKFDREMETSRGDINTVISRWTSKVETKSAEGEAQPAAAAQ